MFKIHSKEGSMTWMGCCSIRKDKALSSLFFLLLLLLLSFFLLPKPPPVLKVFYTRKRQKLLGAKEKKGPGPGIPYRDKIQGQNGQYIFC